MRKKNFKIPKYTISYKNSEKVKLRKHVKTRIDDLKANQNVLVDTARVWDNASQLEVINNWKNRIESKVPLDYSNFNKELEVYKGSSTRVFGTFSEHRTEELEQEYYFLARNGNALIKERNAMISKVIEVADVTINVAAKENYPDELSAKCLQVADTSIAEITDKTATGIFKYNDEIKKINLELSIIEKLTEEGRFKRVLLRPEYYKEKAKWLEELKIEEEKRKRLLEDS